MTGSEPLQVFKHALLLAIFSAATGSTVMLLALAYPQPAPAVLVLALMTPVIASTAVQFYQHLSSLARPALRYARG